MKSISSRNKFIKRMLAMAVAELVFVLVMSVAHSSNAFAASCPSGQTGTPPNCVAATTAPTCGKPTFFGLVPWYQYLDVHEVSLGGGTQSCEVANFNLLPGNGQKSDLPLVLLAIVDDLLRIAGLVAVGFVIYASIGLITSQGNPEEAGRARGTAINALVGLAIAMIAVAFVSFLGNKLGG